MKGRELASPYLQLLLLFYTSMWRERERERERERRQIFEYELADKPVMVGSHCKRHCKKYICI